MKLKLRARYALLFGGVTVLVVAAVNTSNLLESLRYQHDVKVSSAAAMSAGMLREVESAGIGLTAMMASSLLAPIFEEDFDEIANIVRAATGLAYVRRALVYDHNALVIHDGTDEIRAYGEAAPATMRDTVIGAGEVFIERQPDSIKICHPIKIGHRVLGGVAVTIRLDQAVADIAKLQQQLNAITEEATRRRLQDAVIYALAISLLGVIVGIWIALRLSRPISQLTGIAAQIAQRRYHFELPFHRSDELGELAEGLRSMARELEDSTFSRAQLETEIVHRTAQLREVNKKLKLLDTNRRRFFAEVSHELKTPLTVIRGEADVMLRNGSASTEEFRECLQRIAEQTKQVGRLVNDLIDLAQAEAENFRFEEADVDFSAVVSASCDDASILAEAGDVKISPHIATDSLMLRGDAQRLRQLCLVLLENAIRHSDLGTVVLVACREENGNAVLNVTDDGVGMSQPELDSVFDGFDRSAAKKRRNTGGTGLGLPIAKTIVEAHRGTIAIMSELGRGTKITVQLPLHAPAAAGTRAGYSPDKASSLRRNATLQ